LFTQGARFRRRHLSPNFEFSLAQGIEHSQLFRHGPSGQTSPKDAFVFENLLQVETHGYIAQELLVKNLT
jgi:hypothetical protein